MYSRPRTSVEDGSLAFVEDDGLALVAQRYCGCSRCATSRSTRNRYSVSFIACPNRPSLLRENWSRYLGTYQPPIFAARAISAAWKELLTRGPASTCLNPRRAPICRIASNSSGAQ